MTTRTAIIYSRVSGEEQARKGYSLPDQREALRKWCEAEGYTIIDDVTDEGWSGAYLERPGLDRVRDLVAAGGVDTVVVLFRDRIARGVAAQLLVEEFAERGTRLCALNAPLDDSPEGELQGGMLDLIAGWERRKIAQRTTRGRLAKAKKGLLIATHTPHFGFRYTPERTAYLIDEPAMKTVARVFELVGDRGLTLYGTAKALQAEVRPAPGGGSRWGEKTIRDIVQDDVYFARPCEEVQAMVGPEAASRLDPGKSYGIVWYPRRKVITKPVAEPDGFGGKRYRKVQTEEWRPLSECVPIPVVDSTIPPNLVRAARNAIEHNAATSRTGERLWELTGGVLRCGSCGCRMVANRKRNGSEPTKTYNYYRCPTTQRTGTCDNRKSHRAEPLEDAVWDHVWPLLEHPEVVLAGLERKIRREKARVNPEAERRRLVGIIEGARGEASEVSACLCRGGHDPRRPQGACSGDRRAGPPGPRAAGVHTGFWRPARRPGEAQGESPAQHCGRTGGRTAAFPPERVRFPGVARPHLPQPGCAGRGRSGRPGTHRRQVVPRGISCAH
jgi:site-specific DNA recombinase